MAKPIDKQYLIDNMKTFVSVILDPRYIIQKTTLPTASAQNVGVIYQYIGSSASLTKGGFYECQLVAGSDPAEYEWVEISTKTLTDGVTILTNTDKELYVPDASTLTKGVVKIGDGLAIDASTGATKVINRLEEIDELPTAAAALEGKIYLLTATQTGYDRGGIYMCEESTETAGTYEWKLISMSPLEAGKGITIENDVISADTNIFFGTMDEWDALTEAEQAEYDCIATPDEAVEDIVDAIIDGDMRAITSNAVAQVVPSDASSSNKLVTIADITPVGVILPYGGLTAPNNWLFCQGQAVSRTTYSELFAVIGTAFGDGDGSTTFNIPDMRESVPKGAGLTGNTVGAHLDADGLAVGEFIDDRTQSHTHTVNVADGFSYTQIGQPLNWGVGGSATLYANNNTKTTSAPSGRTGATTEVKAVGVNYIIKAI